jgi:hypothetical protein
VAYVPAGYGVGWDGIYGECFMAVGLPVAQSSVDVMAIETNVYDIASGKLIFSALSNTYIEGAKEKALPPFVTTIVGRLADAKLL